MAGIYGDMLLYFPEQMTTISVYEMTAKINGGWDKSEETQQIRGIIQNTSTNTIKDSNGNQAKGAGLELWTHVKGLEEKFTTIDDIVYRIKGNNNWDREGGFIKYILEKVIGNNGTDSDGATWNIGANSFG